MGPGARKGNRGSRTNDGRRRRSGSRRARSDARAAPRTRRTISRRWCRPSACWARRCASALKPDLWVIVSTHWISTFDWFATCQPKHEGLCVAQEAPNLIPGIPYQLSRRSGVRRGAGRRVERVPAWSACATKRRTTIGTTARSCRCNTSIPKGDVPVVGMPVVLMADHGECLRAGAAVHAAAKQHRQARRVPRQHGAVASARARAAELADARARRSGQALRRSAEARRASTRSIAELHRVQQEDRRRNGRPRARHHARRRRPRCRAKASRSRRSSTAITRNRRAAATRCCSSRTRTRSPTSSRHVAGQSEPSDAASRQGLAQLEETE